WRKICCIHAFISSRQANALVFLKLSGKLLVWKFWTTYGGPVTSKWNILWTAATIRMRKRIMKISFRGEGQFT
ncbi:hypothetical protein ATANTOWER_005879, partial [Ataeniobius toweri]|nr:hypothetical protein [Ataeniobius toweri]